MAARLSRLTRSSRPATLALAVLAGAVAPAAAQVVPPLDRQVITAAEIRRAGLARLGDLLSLMDGWALTTIDGFTWRASPRGLAPFGLQDWEVTVDGQPVPLAIFGVRTLDRLPVAIDDIDSIVVRSAPGLYDGRFVAGGLIQVHTRRPAAGLSLRARAMTGEPTGDPGPYRFTPLATPNIDKLGHDFSAVVAFGGEADSLDGASGARPRMPPPPFIAAGAYARRLFATDLAVRERNLFVSPDYPILDVLAGSVRGGFTAAGGTHRWFFARSAFDDLFFLPAFGRELPARADLTHVSAAGEFALSPGTGLAYGAAWSENGLSRSQNALDLDYDFRLARLTGHAALRFPGHAAPSRSGRRVRGLVGVGLERDAAETGYRLEAAAYTLGRAFASVELTPGAEALSISLAGTLAFSENRAAAKANGRLAWRLDPRTALQASAAYVERLPEEDARIWRWHRRGYGFLADARVPITMDGRPAAVSPGAASAGDRFISAEVGWTRTWSRALQVELGAWFRAFSGLDLTERSFRFDPRGQVFLSPVAIRTGRGGQVGGLELSMRAAPAAPLVLRVSAGLQTALGGDDTFRAGWREISDFQGQATAGFLPVPDLSMQARIAWRTAATWTDYMGIAAQTNGRYAARVPGALTLDLVAQKWLWDGRLRGALTLRNVWDAGVRWHPIGGSRPLTVVLQGEMMLAGG